MTINNIKEAAEAAGITAIVSNSREKIETQLNRITGLEDLPLMLISWDLETKLEINEHGFLNNPSTSVVFLLMTKAEDTSKESHELAAQEMGELFQVFCIQLNNLLIKFNKINGPSLTNINFTLVPRHGLGRHSGIIGGFDMIGEITNC